MHNVPIIPRLSIHVVQFKGNFEVCNKRQIDSKWAPDPRLCNV